MNFHQLKRNKLEAFLLTFLEAFLFTKYILYNILGRKSIQVWKIEIIV